MGSDVSHFEVSVIYWGRRRGGAKSQGKYKIRVLKLQSVKRKVSLCGVVSSPGHGELIRERDDINYGDV